MLLEFDVWLCSVAFASVACSADDLPIVEGVESPAADGCDVVGFGAGWQLVGVPGDGCSAEWAFGLALLLGLGDESCPPASMGGGCGAVGVCHRVPRSPMVACKPLIASLTAWEPLGVCLPYRCPASQF